MQSSQSNKFDLTEIARKAMVDRDLLPDFLPVVNAELASITSPSVPDPKYNARDMRDRLWISIDNDNSLDLDQLTYAETTADGQDKIYIAVADVDGLVHRGSAIDKQAAYNTTSVYTPTKVFPMLPPKLSNNLTSLNENTDRCAIVIEVNIDHVGKFELSDIYIAWVHNHAKLTYNRVSSWLEGQVPYPKDSGEINGLTDQLKLQDRIAQLIKVYRNSLGSLNFQTIELMPIIDNEGEPVGLEQAVHNRAHELIENYMISANVAMTRFLLDKKIPVLKRVVRTPNRWDRIVEIARNLGEQLPQETDVIALNHFLIKQHQVAPDKFADLSLAIIKLIGRGEYVVGNLEMPSLIHFDLALVDYSHTTAPNRRYPDLIMHRLLKSFLYNKKLPYTDVELNAIARRCTVKEDDASKVERRVRKSAAAMVLQKLIGQVFPAIVTGATDKGTWVRLRAPPVEGKVVRGAQGLDVGDYVNVKLIEVDIPNGFIDFERVK